MNEQLPVPGPDPDAAQAPGDFLLAMATNPNMDADKLRVVADVYIQMQEKQREWLRQDAVERSRVAFFDAKPAMQAELIVMQKDTPNPRFQNSKFTDFGDMWEANCPIWTRHGFSVSFQTGMTDAGLIHTELWLDHAAGHREVYTVPDARPGMSGATNTTSVQDNQATITYQQRGLVSRGLGIAMKGMDDDGNSAGGRRGNDDPRYTPHTESTAMRDAPIKTAPPPRPSATGKSFVDTALNAIDDAWVANDHYRWKKLVLAAAERVPTVTDLQALQNRLTPTIERDDVPPDVRTELRVAFMQAAKRLATPSFDYAMLTAEGESVDGQIFTQPVPWAREFMACWEATHDREGRENMLHHNADALADARQQPEAGVILADATLADSENPGENTEQTTDENGPSDSAAEIGHAAWWDGLKDRLAGMSGAVFDSFVTAAPTKARMKAMRKDDPKLFKIAKAVFDARHDELHPADMPH